jgi:hypothetical protein
MIMNRFDQLVDHHSTCILRHKTIPNKTGKYPNDIRRMLIDSALKPLHSFNYIICKIMIMCPAYAGMTNLYSHAGIDPASRK